MRVTNRTWLISDTHFGHRNIVQFQQRPETHEVIMLSEWVRLVREDDNILHLGDVFMGSKGNQQRWAMILSRMPGNKFLILGNHDRANMPELYETAGFTIIEPFVQDGVAFTHRPISPNSAWAAIWEGQWDKNVHGHIHLNGYQGEFGDNLIPGKFYVNLSIEATDFRPVQFGNIPDRLTWTTADVA